MHAQIQRLALLMILTLTNQAYAACEELLFSLTQQMTVEQPQDHDIEEKERVRIMPVGSAPEKYVVTNSTADGKVEVYKRPEHGGTLELVSKWNANSDRGDATLLFEASGHVYAAWVRLYNGMPELVISKVENPLEAVFHFPLANADDVLVSGKISRTGGEQDILSLQTKRHVYVVMIDQLRSGADHGDIK